MIMQGRLADRVALITGAASGIGRGIALRFAQEGAKVSVIDMNLEGAKKVGKEVEDLNGEALAIQCDVSKEEQVNRTVEETKEQLGNIDILVNCAGYGAGNFLADMTTEEWHRMFEIHCDGMFFFSRAVIKSMQEAGRIINTASLVGLTGQVFSTHYAAGKGAIIAFTRSLAMEVAHRGITVNAIAPGLIETPMVQELIDYWPGLDKEIPALRYGQPEDIAEAAVFLASPGAGYITGQVILVDGGLSLTNSVNAAVAKMIGLP